MVNDMEMYLEKVLKKTNPEKYIEILEQDREDFAKEIVELNQIIDKAIEYNYELQERYCHSALFDDLVASKIYEITEKQLNILQGVDKE